MKTCRSIVSMILAVMIIFSVIPMTAVADQTPEIIVSEEEVVIGTDEAPVIQISLEGELNTDAYWSLEAAGPFICEWLDEESFQINPFATGDADLDVVLRREDNDGIIAAKTIKVSVVSGKNNGLEKMPTIVDETGYDQEEEHASEPVQEKKPLEIVVSEEEVTIDRNQTATVQLALEGDLDVAAYWSLGAAGPFTCEWAGEGEFTIYPFDVGEAELEIALCREDNSEPIITKIILVKVTGGMTEEAADDRDKPVNADDFAKSTPVKIVVSQEEVVIDRNQTATVQLSLEGNLDVEAYWSLGAAGPFTCEWTGDGQFTIYPFDIGMADLTVSLCRADNNKEIVSKTISVTVTGEKSKGEESLNEGANEPIVGNEDDSYESEPATPGEPVTIRVTPYEIYINREESDTCSVTVSIKGDLTTEAYWSLEAAGPFTCAWTGEGVFTVTAIEAGESELKVALRRSDNDEEIASKTVKVQIIDKEELVPVIREVTVSASPESVTIDRNKGDTAKVKVSYDGDLLYDAYWSLGAAGPFVCDWTAPGEFTITATDSGEADIEVTLCRADNNEVIASKTVPVKIIAKTAAPTPTKQQDTSEKTKPTNAPTNPPTNVPTNPPTQSKNNPLKDHIVPQIYKVNKITLTNKSGKQQTIYTYAIGLCNVSAYATLVNRFIWEKYGDSSAPCTTDTAIWDVMRVKCDRIWFERKYNSKKGKMLNTTASVTAVGKYKSNGYEVSPAKGTNETTFNSLEYGAKQTKKYNKAGYAIPKISKKKYPSMNRWKSEPKKYYYNYKGHKIMAKGLTAKDYRNPDALAKLVQAHPEGIYIHAKRSDSAQHAVVISGVTVKNGEYAFDILDPTKSKHYTKKVQNKNGAIIDIHSLKINEIDEVAYLYEGK